MITEKHGQRNFAPACDRMERLRMWTPGIGHETKRQECIAGGLPWKHGALIVTVTATALAIASVPADHKDVILVKLNLIPPHDGDEGPHRNRRGVGCECGVLVLSLPSRRALGAAACSWSRGVLLEPRRALGAAACSSAGIERPSPGILGPRAFDPCRSDSDI